jgi:hypothetical protein
VRDTNKSNRRAPTIQEDIHMKRVLAGSFVAAAFAVSLSAQDAPPQSQPMQESKDAAKTVTVAGCLKAGETAESYLLSDLKWGQDKAVGTSGSATPSTPPVAATTLKLIGSPSTKLSDHVGHQVEVSGTIGDKADKPAGATDPAARPAPAAGAQASLNVRNVRMIAANCSAQ